MKTTKSLLFFILSWLLITGSDNAKDAVATAAAQGVYGTVAQQHESFTRTLTPFGASAEQPEIVSDTDNPEDGSAFPVEQESGLDTGVEIDPLTLLSGGGRLYDDEYVWSGVNSHGTMGLGIIDGPSPSGPLYTVQVGKDVNGILIKPTGGKVYDGDIHNGPGAQVWYGAPGSVGGAVRIKKAVFVGVSQLTHKNYCQAMRLALYSNVGGPDPIDLSENGVPTINKDKPLEDTSQPYEATTAHVWMHTMSRCGMKRVIPVGGDGVFAYVKALKLTLVDRAIPTVTYRGGAASAAEKWINAKTVVQPLTIAAKDSGSGIQSLKTVDNHGKPWLNTRVSCDTYHRGASWNRQLSWVRSQVCPSQYERTHTVDFGSLAEGHTQLTSTATDLAGSSANATVLDFWVDRTLPKITEPRIKDTSGNLVSRVMKDPNGRRWVSEKDLRNMFWQLRASDQYSGVKKVVVSVTDLGGGEPDTYQLGGCATRIPVGKVCPETFQEDFSLAKFSDFADDFYDLKATVYDAAGNTTESQKLEFIKDSAPPIAPKNIQFAATGPNSGRLLWTPPVDQGPTVAAPKTETTTTKQVSPVRGIGIDSVRYRVFVEGKLLQNWQKVPQQRDETREETLKPNTLELKNLPNDKNIEIQMQAADKLANTSPIQSVQTRLVPPKQKTVAAPPKDPCKKLYGQPKSCRRRKKSRNNQSARCKSSSHSRKRCKKGQPLPPELKACQAPVTPVAEQQKQRAREQREAKRIATLIAKHAHKQVPATANPEFQQPPTSKRLPPCKYNVFIRGMELSQGPSGLEFRGEQTKQRNPTAAVVDNRQNTLSTMFHITESLENRTVIDQNTGQSSEEKIPILTNAGSYMQAPYVIAGKTTIVRVYLGASGPLEQKPTSRAQVLLEGYRKDEDGSQRKLGEIYSHLTAPDSSKTPMESLRTDAETQANISLPPEWVSGAGSLILHAKALPEQALHECRGCTDGANEEWLQHIDLQQPTPSRDSNGTPKPDLPLMIYKLTWPDNSQEASDQEIQQSLNYAGALLPVPRDAVKPYVTAKALSLSPAALEHRYFRRNSKGQWLCEDVFDAFREFTKVKNHQPTHGKVEESNEGDVSSPKWPGVHSPGDTSIPRLRYVGLIDPSVPLECGGLADRNGRVLISVAGANTLLAHELGHNYGRPHASSVNGADGSKFGEPGSQAYEPWPDNDQGMINGTWFWWAALANPLRPSSDLRNFVVATPKSSSSRHGDLMSYREKQGPLVPGEPVALTSPNTWNRVAEALSKFATCSPEANFCDPPMKEEFPLTMSPLPVQSPQFPLAHYQQRSSEVQRVRRDIGEVGSSATYYIFDPTKPHDRMIQVAALVRDPSRLPPIGQLRMFGEVPMDYKVSTPGKTVRVRTSVPERYVYRAFDKDGKMVAEHEAKLDQSERDLAVWDAPIHNDIFAEATFVLPVSARKLQLVVIEADGTEKLFGERVASDNPPLFRVVYPVEGERWRDDGTTSRDGGRAQVRWEVEDADGQEVHMFTDEILRDANGNIIDISDSSHRGGFVDVKSYASGEGKRMFFSYDDGWYTGVAVSPSYAVEPHAFQKEDVVVNLPSPESDRFGAVEFYVQGYDRNLFGRAPISDDGGKSDGYKWYYKGKLFSRKQHFSTFKFRCSREDKLTFLLVVRGTLNQLTVRSVTTRLVPKRIPRELYRVCGLPKKKKQKRKKHRRKRHTLAWQQKS